MATDILRLVPKDWNLLQMSLREAAGILDKTCHFESSALESRVVSLIEDAEYLEAAAALMRQAEARLVESQG